MYQHRKPSLVQVPEIRVEVSAIPTGGFTDIHADATTIGRAVCIGHCEKVWLLWPPTEKNIILWADNRGIYPAIVTYGSQLEGGLVAFISRRGVNNTLTILAGTLHAVFTTEGGLLAGINYTTAKDIGLAIKMLCIQLRSTQNVESIQEDALWLLNTITAAVYIPKYAISALVSMARLLKEVAVMRRAKEPA